MLNHDDKRSFFRMMVNADLELILDDSGIDVEIEAVCREISSTGLSAEVSEPVEVGALVKAKLSSHNPSVPPFSANAKVVRCAQEFDDSYVLGLEFIEFN
jgi:hypothetical protein